MPTVLNFCPYLPLSQELPIGPWQFIPASSYQGPWLSSAFETASRLFLHHFQGPDRMPIQSPTLIAHAERGIDGVALTGATRSALQGALDFSVLDTAQRWEEDESQGTMAALLALTSDNTEVFVWPIDSEEGRFAVDAGLLVNTLSGGHRLDNPDDVIPCPVEVRVPSSTATVDEEIADALYRALLDAANPGENQRATLSARLLTSLRWWSRAHRNTRSVSWEDRIVMLKTAFEALLNASRAWSGAQRLRDLFESRVDDTGNELYWSPDEDERFSMRIDNRVRSLTGL